jgi:dTDP-4-dehydrorhamnose reductase
MIRIDAGNEDSIYKALDRTDPDVVIYAAANPCKTTAERIGALRVNSIGPCVLGGWCSLKNRFLIYLSSEAVFDGNDESYDRSSPVSPVNFYGLTKAFGEEIVKRTGCRYAIVRMPRLYGYNGPFDRKTPFRNIVENLCRNKVIRLNGSRMEYPTLSDEVASAVTTISSFERQGIFHLSSGQAMTPYEFGLKVSEIFGFAGSLLVESDRGDDYYAEPRPFKVDLSSGGEMFTFSPVEKGLLLVKEQMLSERANLMEVYR